MANDAESRRHALGLLAVMLALVCWACPAILGKALPLAAVPLVFYRTWLGVLWAMSALLLARRRLTFDGLRLSFWAGVALGLDLILFFTSIKLTTVANATAIGSIQPALLVFLAPLLFGERLRWPDIVSAMVAIGGVGLVLFGSQGLPQWSPRGDFFALLTLFAWTGYFVATKRARRHLDATQLTAAVSLFAALLVTPLVLLPGQHLEWPEPRHWLGLAAMAFFGWCGHVLMNWALGNIPIWVGGTSTLAIPIVSSLMAMLFLGESFLPVQLLGMVVVIVALTVVSIRSPQVVGSESAPVDAIDV